MHTIPAAQQMCGRERRIGRSTWHAKPDGERYRICHRPVPVGEERVARSTESSRMNPTPERGASASRSLRRVAAVPDEVAVGRDVEAARLAHLVTRSARGHEDAFSELYDATSSCVYGVILRVLRSPDLAAEVTQEVYLEIWRHAARYAEERGTVLAWMTTVAHRRAVDRVRTESSDSARDHRYAGLNAPTGDRPGLGRSRPADRRRTRPQGDGVPHRDPARSPHPGLLRRLHPGSGRRAAQAPTWHGQDTHQGRPHRPSRCAGS